MTMSKEEHFFIDLRKRVDNLHTKLNTMRFTWAMKEIKIERFEALKAYEFYST